MTADELDDYRKSIGVLFQSGALFNSMTRRRQRRAAAPRAHRPAGRDDRRSW